MKRRDAHNVIKPIAKELGFYARSGRYWRKAPVLCPATSLQQSQWGGGLYVNTGVYLNEQKVKDGAPPEYIWLTSVRAEQVDSPFIEYFEQMVMDDDNEMPLDGLAEAFRWLFMWSIDTFADVESVREQLLDRTTLFGINAWRMAQDWANDQLQPPAEYFRDSGIMYYEDV